MVNLPLPASTTSSPLHQRMLQLSAMSSLRQRRTDLREFTSAAEGLEYNDATLKDLFSYALNKPISTWRRNSTEHLSGGLSSPQRETVSSWTEGDVSWHGYLFRVSSQDGSHSWVLFRHGCRYKLLKELRDIKTELRDINTELWDLNSELLEFEI